MNSDRKNIDVLIIGAGIAGLWTFNHLKSLGYDVLLLEKQSIGCGQTIAAQGIIHSGLKFSLAGKVNTLAKTISAMPDRWRDALQGNGQVDLSAAYLSAESQHLLIPSGFFGGLTKLVTQKALGQNVHNIPNTQWPENLKQSGFKGSLIHMGEPVLDVPSTIRALAKPYENCIKKITSNDVDEFIKQHNIVPKVKIFTSAAHNEKHAIEQKANHGLQTQHRPLLQGMMKNAPFPLFAHLVGKTDKPVVSITTHKLNNGTLIWYLGGGVAERDKDANPLDVYEQSVQAFAKYLPNVDFTKAEWAALPIDRVEGKSKTDSWMPDTPTIHETDGALYCWPTKLTFAPLLGNMVLNKLQKRNITPSKTQTSFEQLQPVEYTKTPWQKIEDNKAWTKLN